MPNANPAPALTAPFLQATFQAGKAYPDYVATGTDAQQKAWADIRARATLTEAQTKLITAFTRKVNILVSSGVWCGDCVQQLPLLQAIADASPLIQVRYVDRDEHADFASLIKICAGTRVPVAVYMAEDFEPVSIFGDRTLTRYRAIAARNLGPACPIPGAPIPDDELQGTLQDWLNETERAHLLLRLSTRLRQRHND
ncbi:MAG: thioredoxin family protein [Phycisphaerales bacterium]